MANDNTGLQLGVFVVTNILLIAVDVFFFITPSCIVETAKHDSMYSNTVFGDLYKEYEEFTLEAIQNAWNEDYIEPKSIDPVNYVLAKGHYKHFPEDDDFDPNFECGKSVTKIDSRILGGSIAPAKSWPWIVQVVPPGYKYKCAGTLVSPRHTITAAHCLQRDQRYDIAYGHKDYEVGRYTSTRAAVIYVRYHPGYNRHTQHMDHAILTHDKVTFNDVTSPACLPLNNTWKDGYKDMWVAGWGSRAEGGTGDTGAAPFLQHAKVPLKSCDIYEFPKDLIICAGKKDLDACQGDSGGPFGAYHDGKWYLFGIVSFGEGCARERYPGAYAEIVPMMNWFCCYMRKAPSCKNVMCNWQGTTTIPVRMNGTDEVSTGKNGSVSAVGGPTGENGNVLTGGGPTEENGNGLTGSGPTGENVSDSIQERAGSSLTNDLGVCIGELQIFLKGWYLDGTPKPDQSNYKPTDLIAASKDPGSLNFKSRSSIQARLSNCPCGLMDQQYFDYLKEHDILSYNKIWREKASESLEHQPDLCDEMP